MALSQSVPSKILKTNINVLILDQTYTQRHTYRHTCVCMAYMFMGMFRQNLRRVTHYCLRQRLSDCTMPHCAGICLCAHAFTPYFCIHFSVCVCMCVKVYDFFEEKSVSSIVNFICSFSLHLQEGLKSPVQIYSFCVNNNSAINIISTVSVYITSIAIIFVPFKK